MILSNPAPKNAHSHFTLNEGGQMNRRGVETPFVLSLIRLIRRGENPVWERRGPHCDRTMRSVGNPNELPCRPAYTNQSMPEINGFANLFLIIWRERTAIGLYCALGGLCRCPTRTRPFRQGCPGSLLHSACFVFDRGLSVRCPA